MLSITLVNGIWVLTNDDARGSAVMGSVSGVSYREAIDVFAANRPDLAEALDELACDELTGCLPAAGKANTTRHDAPRQASNSRPRLGSGARFRELYGLGKTNAEALAVVRQEFPQSKAGLSDAAWNRARWKKESAARAAADDLSELL